MSAAAPELWVNLSTARREKCSAGSCRQPVAYEAVLAYCLCDERPEEHGHPNGPDASQDTVWLCVEHGAAVRGWESLQSIRTAATS